MAQPIPQNPTVLSRFIYCLITVGLTINGHRATRWASATFVGARHRLEMTVAGGAARAWLADLAEAELTMPGHLVADLIVLDARHDAADTIAAVEVLTVEDGA